MRNLTLAIEEDLLKAAREYALAHDTTVNQMVREYLEETVDRERRCREAAARLRQRFVESQARVGPIVWTRDDINER